MAKIFFSKKVITIKLEGIKKFLALKGTIKIPLRCIKRVSTEPVKWLIFTPKAGTNFPGVLMAGTFFQREGMVFYYTKNPKKCIILSLDGHRFSKVVIEVNNKLKTANQIRHFIKEYKS